MRRQLNEAKWLHDRLAVVPGPWRGRVCNLHTGRLDLAKAIPAGTGEQSEAIREANVWLRETTGRLGALRVPVTLTDTDLCELARKLAKDAMGMGEYAPSGGGLSFNSNSEEVRAFYADKPFNFYDKAQLRQRLAAFVARYGIRPPEPRRLTKRGTWAGIEDVPAIRRMTDHLWWRRGLRVAQARNLEAEAIRLGYVHRQAEIYASDVTVERRRQQRKRNADALDQTEAINLDTGEAFKLAELAARSVANPRIRRGELMTRISGFESVARGLGHVGMFYTWTCPSRMHAKKAGAGSWLNVIDNKRYDGTTPREAARYLGSVWAKCRAALHRAGAFVYGFRIAEPHHDGCPHWHLLLFMAKEVAGLVTKTMRRYACKEDAGELGNRPAQLARFKAIGINWNRGTAAGYIAKYVSKNIDGGGYQVQGDIEGPGHDAMTTSQRVEAWASTWGIRQFQQVGGPPVGVWRELRRLDDGEHTDRMRQARSAADVGNWARYVEVMGGPIVSRRDLPVRVAYTRAGERFDHKAGESYPAPLTRYGEEAKGVIYGVRDVVRDRAYPSRRFRWEIKRGGTAANRGGSGQLSRGRPSGVAAESSAATFGFTGTAQPAPWTRVNNCTEGTHEPAKKDGSGGGRRRKQVADGAAAHQGHGGAVRRADLGGVESNQRGTAPPGWWEISF
jgi:hypothetical protein